MYVMPDKVVLNILHFSFREGLALARGKVRVKE